MVTFNTVLCFRLAVQMHHLEITWPWNVCSYQLLTDLHKDVQKVALVEGQLANILLPCLLSSDG